MQISRTVTIAALLVSAATIEAQAQLRSRVVASGFTSPVAFVQDPANRAVQFVVEQGGRVRVVRDGAVVPTLFLDLSGAIATGGERGLLGMAFPPDAATSGRVFVNFTNTAGHTVVARFRRLADPLVVDPGSRFDLRWGGAGGPAFIARPYSNHNGGHLAFGPDGFLYIGLGDGGSANDPEHRAQDPTELLGKMLRIDVNVPDSHASGYQVPADNPFVGPTSVTARPEIWSFGLRNPWRYNFDDPARGGTGALFIGDVGQGRWEEIDYEPPGRGGRNYGWRNREGAHDNMTSLPPAYLPLVDPIHEYDHATGHSITGGYVYRGRDLGPAYQGRYFFADFVQGRVGSMALVTDPATGDVRASDLVEHTAELGRSAALGTISAFGLDADGELYLVSYSLGRILKVLGPPPTGSCTYSVLPAEVSYGTTGGSGTIAVTTSIGCAWTAASSHDFVVVTAGSSGTGPGTVSYTVGANSGAANRSGTLTVSERTVTVYQAGANSSEPFGAIDTPANGVTGVTGSLGVTGWALDDVGISRVRIYRDALGSEPAGASVFIGDATLVAGARPDVATAYPSYPFKDRAGWGYMLLTNMLPNQGSGTYTLRVYADDVEGHSVNLGFRTITCTNATATLPFGAIDTPAQGATISGASYVNFGWALTPVPKTIPTNGSTITVYIDGAAVGNVTFNNYRPDVATAFPGYANTNGAVGYRYLDATTLADGVHTISWNVFDDAGAGAGIGSRYFTVQNGSSLTAAARTDVEAGLSRPAVLQPVEAGLSRPSILRPVEAGFSRPDSMRHRVSARMGFDLREPLTVIEPDASGRRIVTLPEVGRLELHLGDGAGGTYRGALRVGDTWGPLPIGSQLDATTGVFLWQPGVGFIGTYELEFGRTDAAGNDERIPVTVVIRPKHGGASRVQTVIDLPVAGEVTQPFVVAGWALDEGAVDGTGIDSIHVWAYPTLGSGEAPTFLGVATLDGERLDVAQAFGAQFIRSGFGVVVNGLAPGIYDVAVFPRSAVTNEFAPAKVVRVTVR